MYIYSYKVWRPAYGGVKREDGENPLQPRYCEGLRKLIWATVPPKAGREGSTSRSEARSQETCQVLKPKAVFSSGVSHSVRPLDELKPSRVRFGFKTKKPIPNFPFGGWDFFFLGER
jgi:hypothetical protein